MTQGEKLKALSARKDELNAALAPFEAMFETADEIKYLEGLIPALENLLERYKARAASQGK